MNVLFDKKVNVDIMNLNKTSRVHISSRKPTNNWAMKMNQERKNDVNVNNVMFLMKQKSCEMSLVYKACIEKLYNNYNYIGPPDFRSMILHTRKVPYSGKRWREKTLANLVN